MKHRTFSPVFLLSVPQTCSNEVKCICDPDYTGKDCSVFDPIPIPTPPEGPEKYRGTYTTLHLHLLSTLKSSLPLTSLLIIYQVSRTWRLQETLWSYTNSNLYVIELRWDDLISFFFTCFMDFHAFLCHNEKIHRRWTHKFNFFSSQLPFVFLSTWLHFTPTGPSGTNIIIGSVAGAILLAAIVLGGTGWGFK